MKSKVLISGIYYEGGGLGNVMNYLATHLAADFDITCMAFLPWVNEGQQKLERLGQRVYHIPFKGNRYLIPDEHVLYQQIRNHEYESTILLGPINMNKILIDQLKQLDSSMSLVAFIPYEGKVINLYEAPVLNKLDFGVFYSRFTYDCFDALNTYEAAITDFYQRFGYIHHGVDQQKFYPISTNRKEKMKIARSFISEYKDLPEDAFIILNSNKPFYRKGTEATLSAFQQFSSQHPDSYLHLHIGSVSTSSYEYLMKSVNEYSLNERVIVTYSAYPAKAHSDEWMNYLYNACNVGLSSSCGEGWGLGIFEHAATGAPVIVPRHTVFIENWKNIAILTNTDDVKYLASENTEVYLSSVDSICDALNNLYHSEELYEDCATRCFYHATSPKYDWSITSDYFREILINQRIDVPLTTIS